MYTYYFFFYREDLVKTLSRAGNELDVKTLLKNLQLTLEFENQLLKRFAYMVNILNAFVFIKCLILILRSFIGETTSSISKFLT